MADFEVGEAVGDIEGVAESGGLERGVDVVAPRLQAGAFCGGPRKVCGILGTGAARDLP